MRRYEGTRLEVQERYVQVLDEFIKGIRVFSETSSSMICMVNATSKNEGLPKSSIMNLR
jgi:hypothetical protein